MSGRAMRSFLIAIGVIVALAAAFHLFGGGAMRALGEALHGR